MRNKEYYHSHIEVQDEPFPKIEITDEQYIELKPIVNLFNNSHKDIKYGIVETFPIKDMFPLCRICGKVIVNENWKILLTKTFIQIIAPGVYKRTINGKEYFLSCCEDCLLDKFKDTPPKSTKYYYMKANKYGAYSFGYSEHEYKQITSMTVGATKENMIRKWGEDEGTKRWNEYCRKQAETNTFEYKQEKYGWDKETFDEFNKSRACTIKNFIDRYGEVEGMRRWNDYVNIQKETKSWEYMVEKFGEQRAKEINTSKALVKRTFINKYGKELGEQKWLEYFTKANKFYSQISQDLFIKLDKILNIEETYFAAKNYEYCIDYIDNGIVKTYMLDYYIPSLKLCVEFNGDLWHANPNKYKSDDIVNPFNNMTAKQIWDLEEKRTKIIENYGIKVIKIWESEYKSKDFDINKFIKEKLNIDTCNN